MAQLPKGGLVNQYMRVAPSTFQVVYKLYYTTGQLTPGLILWDWWPKLQLSWYQSYHLMVVLVVGLVVQGIDLIHRENSNRNGNLAAPKRETEGLDVDALDGRTFFQKGTSKLNNGMVGVGKACDGVFFLNKCLLYSVGFWNLVMLEFRNFGDFLKGAGWRGWHQAKPMTTFKTGLIERTPLLCWPPFLDWSWLPKLLAAARFIGFKGWCNLMA